MSDLEEIKQRIDIVQFISEHVTVKKTGRNFKANCPFHSEKTPSFVISPERQIWHCFGACNTGGDIFTFLMKTENIDFPEALEILAKRAGVKLTREYRTTDEQRIKDEIYKANRLASSFYHYLLTSHKIGQKARDYLDSRGISRKIWETFSLGYSPLDWESLVHFLQKKGFDERIILKAGLALSGKTGRPYDRFRGRLIFTLRDHRENVIGFSGRKMEQVNDREEAKYINTSETPVYTKGNVLYGLDVTKESIKKENEVIIVEGEFDLLSSFQAGVTNIVAIKGSALTQNQASLLKRFAESISLGLDADIAGDAASRRGIEIADNIGFNIKVIQVPQGKDPDECIKENPSLWKKAVKESIPVYDFLLNSSLSRNDKNTAFGKKKIVEEIMPFYAKISNSIIQSHYLSLLAKTINISEDRLTEVLNKVVRTSLRQDRTSVAADDGKKELIIEEHILSLFLQLPALDILTKALSLEELIEITNSIENPVIRKICEHFSTYVRDLNSSLLTFDAAKFIKLLPEELIPVADKAYLIDLQGLAGRVNDYKDELIIARNKLVCGHIRRKLAGFTTKLKEGQDDDSKMNDLNTEFNNLKKRLKELEAQGLS